MWVCVRCKSRMLFIGGRAYEKVGKEGESQQTVQFEMSTRCTNEDGRSGVESTGTIPG